MMFSGIIKNFFWRCVQIFGKQGASFLIFIFAAKMLSQYDFGVYNYAMAAAFLLVMLSDFGISTAVAKYVAEYHTLNDSRLQYVFFNATLGILSLSLMFIAVMKLFGTQLFGISDTYVLMLTPLIIFSPLTSLLDGVFRGLRKFKMLALLSTAAALISLPLIYILIRGYGLRGAFWGQNIFYVTLFISLMLFYREYHLKLNRRVIKEIGGYSFVFGLAVLGYYFFSRIDVIILGRYGYITEIASYELLNKLFGIALLPFAIAGQVLAPEFTALYANRQYDQIRRKYVQILGIGIATAIVSAAVLFFILPIIIKLFLPAYYNSLLFALLMTCISIFALQFFNAPINAGIVVATGSASLMTYMNIGMGIANIFLALALLHFFGFVGVILATLVSNFIGTLILQYRFWRHLKNLHYV